jgi:hypothetical protein
LTVSQARILVPFGEKRAGSGDGSGLTIPIEHPLEDSTNFAQDVALLVP